MYLRHLSLADFRSWAHLELPLGPGPVVLVGPNGAGKTNIVEAVYYLAALGSHRVAADTPLIRREAERALVRAAAVSAGRELLVEIEIGAGRANKSRLNRGSQRPVREIAGIVRAVLFAPEDLAIVRGDPADRRSFLDDLLVMRAPRLAGVKADYDRILRQRATLLKTAGGARRSGSALDTLGVWDEHLAAAGSELMAARLDLVDALRPFLATGYARIAPESGPADISYRSDLLGDDDAPGDGYDGVLGVGDGGVPGVGYDAPLGPNHDPAELAAAMRAAMLDKRDKELDRGVCLVGPHRDDLLISLGGGPAKGYASHGEAWSLALALRLASFDLLRSDGVEPILLLDDVFATLDGERRRMLADIASHAEQTIITAAVADDVPADLSGNVVFVADGVAVTP